MPMELGLSAQELTFWELPVQIEGESLEFAAAGGLNNPQWQMGDLDADGMEDLLIYDGDGENLLAFKWKEELGQYVYRPALTKYFPRITRWAILRDFNKDGAPDLFTYSHIPGAAGVILYEGRFEARELKFQQWFFSEENYPLIIGEDAEGDQFYPYVGAFDYPVIDDVDFDGDIDMLAYDFSGFHVVYFENQSIEEGYGNDTIIFFRGNTCWGGFLETGESLTVDLADFPGECAENSLEWQGEERHGSSTLCLLDYEEDGDADLLIAEVSSTQVQLLSNGGNNEQAWINEQSSGFPNPDSPIDLSYLPAVFRGDFDHDGSQDLLASPYFLNTTDTANAHLYSKSAGGNANAYELLTKNFLSSEMLDFGNGAYPAFADVNADGLDDLVIGNNYYFDTENVRTAALHLLINVGSQEEPEFELTDSSWLDLHALEPSTYGLAPTFGDLDNDGDLDIVVGDGNGNLFLSYNDAGAGNPMVFTDIVYQAFGINQAPVLGQNAVPFLADLNRDGALDLLIGELNGNLNYFQNQGSPAQAVFDPNPENAPNNFLFGGINFSVIGAFGGFTAPAVLDFEGSYQLFIGTESGHLFRYEDIEFDLAGVFPEPDTLLNGQVGRHLHYAWEDLDQDGDYELICGNQRGGINAFYTDLNSLGVFSGINDSEQVKTASSSFYFYPNPASTHIYFSAINENLTELSMYDLAGSLQKRTTLSEGQTELQIDGLLPGVYLLELKGDKEKFFGKLLVR